MSAIVQCKCESKQPGDAAEFQTRRYGVGARVAVPTEKVDKTTGKVTVRCTVCGNTHEVSQSKLI